MNQQSEHLSDAEVEQYGEMGSSTEPGAVDRRDRIGAHLADCSACSERVLASQRVRLALLAASPVTPAQGADRRSPGRPGPEPDLVRRPSPDRRTPDCPDEDELLHLVGGLLPPEQSTKLTQHAAQCDHCGPLLRIFIEDFSDELSGDDQAVFGRLKSSSAGWQQKLVREMITKSDAAPAQSAKKPFAWRWVLAPAALAACGLIAFAVWYTQRDTPEKVEKLLAQAYTEQRTMEMRWPEAEWGPIRVARGPVDSRFSVPDPLLKAEMTIAHQPAISDNNPEWLRLQVEAGILDGHAESAEGPLKAALASQPDSIALALAAGIVYFQQGEATQNTASYEKSVDFFSQVLKNDSSNRTALFNRAVAFEKLNMLDRAKADFELLARTETDPGWLKETLKRLGALKK